MHDERCEREMTSNANMCFDFDSHTKCLSHCSSFFAGIVWHLIQKYRELVVYGHDGRADYHTLVRLEQHMVQHPRPGEFGGLDVDIVRKDPRDRTGDISIHLRLIGYNREAEAETILESFDENVNYNALAQFISKPRAQAILNRYTAPDNRRTNNIWSTPFRMYFNGEFKKRIRIESLPLREIAYAVNLAKMEVKEAGFNRTDPISVD